MKSSGKMSSAEERKTHKQKKLTKNTKNEKNKNQVMKHKKNNNPRQSPPPCRDIACLNNLLKVLKLSKDNVVNFIAQEKRLQRSLNTAGKIIYAIHAILKYFSKQESQERHDRKCPKLPHGFPWWCKRNEEQKTNVSGRVQQH
jgi:hypothetical protein